MFIFMRSISWITFCSLRTSYIVLTFQVAIFIENVKETNHASGLRLWLNQIYAMFLKKFISTKRSYILLIIHICIPVLLIVPMIITSRNKSVSDLKPMKISLSKYYKPVTVVTGSSEYKQAYKDISLKDGSVKEVDDIREEILKIGKDREDELRKNYIVGASFSSDRLIGWFNNEPYHSPPLALLNLQNSILKTKAGRDYNIEVNNHPLPYALKKRIKGESSGLELGKIIVMAFSFVASYFIVFAIKERVSGSKHLQYISGAKVVILWMTSYVWDFLVFCIFCSVVIIILVCYQVDDYKTYDDWSGLFLVFALFGLATLPLIYLVSLVFKMPPNGYMAILTVYTLVAMVGSFLTMAQDPNRDVPGWLYKCHLALSIVPAYLLSCAIENIKTVNLRYKSCSSYIQACMSINMAKTQCEQATCEGVPQCCEIGLDYFAWDFPGIGKIIAYLLIIAAVLLLLLLLIEYGVVRFILYRIAPKSNKKRKKDQSEDDDVAAEREKIRSKTPKELKEYALAMKDVTKTYRKLVAVDRLCLGINNYECFGLLGVNGAGKTTTFKMMTGEIRVTSGQAWVNGFNLITQMSAIRKVIGYCPQFDGLLENLTGRETIVMICLLRGLSHEESKATAEKLAKDFDFYRHIDKKIYQYSGGNKRKLSTALALIGDPQVIYLDEPTTGMDPATKRFIWNNINRMRDNGKCVVLTSHSMEECEALCTRIAIMVNGSFKCLGSNQHLKNKFSQGYTVMIRMQRNSTVQDRKVVEAFINQKFPNAEMKESHEEMVSYFIPGYSVPGSKIFGTMERAKQQLKIEDYSVGQSTLEQVFLQFTMLEN